MIYKIMTLIFCFSATAHISGQTFKYDKKLDKFIFRDSGKDMHYDIAFDEVYEFEGDYCVVGDGEKWGLVDSYGDLSHDLIYSEIIFKEKYWMARAAESWGILDPDGGSIIEVAYDSIGSYSTLDTAHLILHKSKTEYIYHIEEEYVVGEMVYSLEEGMDEISFFEDVKDRPTFGSCASRSNDEARWDCSKRAVQNYVVDKLKPTFQGYNFGSTSAWVSFIVSRTGSVSGVNMMEKTWWHVDKEIFELISAMPNWQSASGKGSDENVEFVLPIQLARLH